ncbi:probable Pleiotropic ABC efflux transporter of multiple drugs [Zygosaccharomyces bailii ISA1307]|nr:probable Pleiotropic ABC efflux transporter of multiple drugs [Zygosaccharomyces bailii ISA1307]
MSEVGSDAPVYKGFEEDAQEQIKELAKTFTRQTIGQETGESSSEAVNPVFKDGDKDYDERLDPNSDQFQSKEWVRNMSRLMSADPDYYKPYSLGCCWRNLSAYGASADVAYQQNAANMPFQLLQMAYRYIRPSRDGDTFQILKPMDGLINPGELLVVLGRPGSGCTTLLKSICSNTHGFHLSKDTQVSYGGLTPMDIKKHFRGEVVYNAEADIHLPHLTVWQTLITVARLKTPSNRVPGVDRETWANHMADVAMATYGLSHTRNTRVGSELVRGVSGGERKRVSIAEVMICGSKFQCWDNATRGLDSATALEFVRALKTQASLLDCASAVAIYQCSQEAFDLFDKVCVLYDGYQIYFGPAEQGKKYFEDMGYHCPARQTTADFLTAVTSPAERIIRDDYKENGVYVPQTAQEMSEYWTKSTNYNELINKIENEISGDKQANVSSIKAAHIAKQAKRARSSSPYTASYFQQVKYLLIRDWWRLVNSFNITFFQIFGNATMAFILGSMFYKIMKKDSTATFYSRGAAMFFAVLFNSFTSMLEIFSLFEARPITEKHRTYSLYHPSADAFASALSEVPPRILISVVFNIVFYFLVHFRRDGGRFFFYYMMSLVGSFTMSHLFRTVGSLVNTLSEAMIPAAIILLALSMYTGFAIPETKMLGWSKWIWYINPLSYIFESLMLNEFHDRKFPCAQFIPSGPGYANVQGTEKVCAAVGAISGKDYVLGDDFLKLSYNYENVHKWRGFGVGMAYVIFFFFVYLFLVEFNEGAKQKGEILVFPHSAIRKMKKQNKLNTGRNDDEEKYASEENVKISDKKMLEDSEESSSNGTGEVGLSKSQAIFHWRNLCYDVQVKKETRRILNGVDGWVKPGTLTALMGASGAGKTTLLDCLAERVTMGVITGDVFVNGEPRDTSFPRSIGYCQQQDLHLTTATVRESLRFSAYLRQPSSVSKEEKDDYVEQVIDILEMSAYADAVVGVAGEGLNVEQRKRLTIGVELVARPKLLLFLDEPTSGLDSQTAWSVCQLMKKLAKHGQAILCTIHQPSAILMQEFDRLLFMQRGGKTVYFGELGEGCKTMIDYFEKYGAHKCPSDANPAEWMLEVVGAAPGSHANQDYYEVWKNSTEYVAVQEELDRMERELPSLNVDQPEGERQMAYATDVSYQCYLVSKRLFEQYWRTPSYLWAKMFLTIVNQLFIGFTFFKADRSMQGLQNQMLSVFMFCVIFNPILQQYLPSFVKQRDLYEARERSSRTYSWKAFIFAQIVVEVPWNIFAGTMAFFIYYYPVGFYSNASMAGQLHERGALFWLYSIAFYVYIGSMAIFAISFNELEANAANLASLLFTMTLSFCGVMATPSAMPHFWIFMYRVSPLTYFISGVLATGLANVPITCSSYEYVVFAPPRGQTCGQYMSSYIKSKGTGYLADSSATEKCEFCQFSKTNDYLKELSSSYSDRWRNYGIFICYIAFNYIAAVLLYWLARVPKKNKKSKN